MSSQQSLDAPSRALLVAALDALDREGDLVAAAHVSLALALAQVDRRTQTPRTAP